MLFPKNISGGYPGAWGPELLAAITHEYLLKWKFAVSLDFSHAFDTINVKMVQEALLCILPSGCHAWITLLTEHWMNLRRWFCFDGHIHQNALTMEVGIPQGDPASPLIMTILLRVGYGLVEESLKDHCFQAIYMDDRAVVTDSWEKVLLAQQTWANFAEKIHMIENHTKAQLVDVEGNNGKAGVIILVFALVNLRQTTSGHSPRMSNDWRRLKESHYVLESCPWALLENANSEYLC